MLGIEVWYTFNGCRIAARVEVDDFLVGVLEGENDGVGWECCEGGMEFLRTH
jgi:hypothetical protein